MIMSFGGRCYSARAGRLEERFVYAAACKMRAIRSIIHVCEPLCDESRTPLVQRGLGRSGPGR